MLLCELMKAPLSALGLAAATTAHQAQNYEAKPPAQSPTSINSTEVHKPLDPKQPIPQTPLREVAKAIVLKEEHYSNTDSGKKRSSKGGLRTKAKIHQPMVDQSPQARARKGLSPRHK